MMLLIYSQAVSPRRDNISGINELTQVLYETAWLDYRKVDLVYHLYFYPYKY